MLVIPDFARPVLSSFAPVFYHPTYLRFLILLVAAVLTTGRRTVSNLLRTAADLAPGHPSSYHRVLSRRRWSSLQLARILARFILDHWAPDGPICLAGDDTVDEHRGAKVFGKGCHRDPVRSTHSYTAYRWGHKWVVLAILVQFPFAKRPWALPVLAALYRNPEKDPRACYELQ
jgi:DDE superfamily endonuclease